MKKTLSGFLILILTLSFAACGSSGKIPENFPLTGTWANEERKVFLRIQDDGVLIAESLLTSSSTSTVNGVTTSSKSYSTSKSTYNWTTEKGKIIYNKTVSLTPAEQNGQYILQNDTTTYFRIGDTDYDIVGELNAEEEKENADLQNNAAPYTFGETISHPGFEIVLTESGVAQDIRVTSSSSGIQITSGPSAEAGKQYVYLKGTLKNTAKSAIRPAIAGMVYLDDYTFTLESDTIQTSGSPSFNVDPLETVTLLLYAQVTDEMADSFTNGRILFGLNDNFTDVELSQADHLYMAEIQ